jgi:ATP-dependent DNA helicase RecG
MKSNSFLDTPVEYLKGVGPKRAEVLKKELQIVTFHDLITHYPFRYMDRTKYYTVREINNDLMYYQVKGRISKVEIVGKNRAQRLVAILKDQSGEMEMIWFQGIRWIREMIKPGMDVVVFGKPAYFNGSYNFPHPEFELLSERKDHSEEHFQPFYNTTEKLKTIGLDSKGIRKIIRNLVDGLQYNAPETLPGAILSRLKLLGREDALISIHFPNENTMLERAIARLKFEELFYIQLQILKGKIGRQKFVPGQRFARVGEVLNQFYREYLPFELTDAQKRVIKEIRFDIGSGKQMNRLLQGDVGSGKTLVALMTMLIAIDNGFQACLMAPTEILAEQHFRTFTKMLGSLPVNVELLTGSTKAANRRRILESLQVGSLHIIIGTHALIEDRVVFDKLGLVVIDEQHRFGVVQRSRLWQKSDVPPHILVMTATPIPRTLAMTLYGDLDVSVIDQLPPGRKPVKTFHFFDRGRLKVFASIRRQIEEGRQVYFVYPMIKESESLDLKYLMDGYESICREFPLPDYAVSIVHGKMKTADKDFEMQRFIRGETQLMVATTVIEVGVDVPNASVMVIENAERFGLSQLHQLRGRVGRGADQSFCILLTSEKLTNEGKQRIATMVKTTDGFEIAEVDLRLRGPGDLQGTMQSGVLDLKLADIVRDEKMLKLARDLANDVLVADPLLSNAENQILAKEIKRMEKHAADFSRIS